MNRMTTTFAPAALVCLAALMAGCHPIETIRTAIAPASAHDRYVSSLRGAGLDETALGRSWISASETVLQDAHHVTLPFSESGFFSQSEASAVAYRFTAQRGERIVVEVARDHAYPVQLFVDLFEATEDTARAPRLVETMRDDEETLAHTSRGRAYVLRIQPELLRDVRYSVTVRTTASIAFPVEGFDSRSIRSVFGDPRDGGRRRHEGVDIFAPRGTPVVAAAPGIAATRENRLGGRVVWVRELLGSHSYYYAHLDSQIVRAGTRVSVGDTLGLVGNTGNARNTPPHLHFGIYARGEGAIDPIPFIHTSRQEPPALAVDDRLFGRMARVTASTANVRQGPSTAAEAVDLLPVHTAVRIRGGSGAWYRIELPDGRTGFVSERLVGPMEQPFTRRALAEPIQLMATPAPDAVIKATVPEGRQLAVLGLFGDFHLVESESGETGWARL